MRLKGRHFVEGLLAVGLGIGGAASGATLDQWIPGEIDKSLDALSLNVSPPNTLPGTVIASPSQTQPDYYYHWVRDASIVMDAMATLYAMPSQIAQQSYYYNVLMDFAALSRQQQLTPNLSGNPGDTGLGEPKFNVDGTAYGLPWGRPQNDGAASRALAMIHFANALIQNGQMSVVQTLYVAQLPANTVIKADLEYVAHHWGDLSFDLWEEVKGDHFYTNMVQRRAMIEGAAFATLMNDPGAAAYYQQQAQALETQIQGYWNAQSQLILPTLNSQNDPACGPKTSGLDVAVILGALVGCASDGFFCPGSVELTATANQLQAAFAALYPINQTTTDPSSGEALGTAIGRYPEDCYTGNGSAGPAGAWFLATNAFAQLDYQMAQTMQTSGSIELSPPLMTYFQRNRIGAMVRLQAGELVRQSDPRFAVLIQDLQTAGDNQLRRSKYHSAADGSMSEQMNRDTGYMQSADNLSWSYASFLTAAWARPTTSLTAR